MAGFRITFCFHVGVGMYSDPLSENPNRIKMRWLFLLGIIMTLVNGFFGFFFARKHGGPPHDNQLLMGILIPHIALGSAAGNSRSKVAFWIRLSLWIASNAFLFLPVATKTLDYFTRWMAGRFNAADVGGIRRSILLRRCYYIYVSGCDCLLRVSISNWIRNPRIRTWYPNRF
ncbi:MAG: hypothetical protein ACK6B2_13190 [Planctomycetota bacterium]